MTGREKEIDLDLAKQQHHELEDAVSNAEIVFAVLTREDGTTSMRLVKGSNLMDDMLEVCPEVRRCNVLFVPVDDMDTGEAIVKLWGDPECQFGDSEGQVITIH